MTVESGWDMVLGVGVTSVELPGKYQTFETISGRVETELTGAEPTRCGAEIVGVRRRIGKISLYCSAR